MKKIIISMILAAACLSARAQKLCPNVDVFTDKGEVISVLKLIPQDKPVVISFWDTSCKPCLQEMGALSDVYDDWKDEMDFEIIAVSTDDSRSSSKAVPLAKGRGWPFIIALDRNGDFKRALNVQSNPTVFILNKEGKIVDIHIGYTPGDEQQVHDILKKHQ